MTPRATTPATLLAALVLPALLAGCAAAQKPATSAAAPAPDTTPQASAVEVPAGDAAAPDAAPAARAKATPEAAGRARLRFEEGVRLQAAGNLGAAVAAFEDAAASDPDLAWASFDAGLLRERQGDDAGAIRAYERALEARPDLSQAAQNLVRVWLRQGRRDEAERELRARLAVADGVALRVGLAEVLLAAGSLDAAEAECRAALKADEKNVPAMVVLATTYSQKKRYELARMVLENARQVDAGDPAVWNRLGFVELALGNRVQSIEHFKTAAALRPDYPEAHANYGAMLADADDFAGAAQELEVAVRYAPRAAGAWLVLGNAYRGLLQFEKSEQAYRKALELDPALNDATFNLAILHLDVEKPGLPTLARLEAGLAWFDTFEKQGGVEPRVAGYRKDAAREIDREKKRLAREEKDRVRKEAEARRKVEEEQRLAAEARAAAEATLAAEAAAAQAAADAAAAQAAAKAAAAPPASPGDAGTPPATPPAAAPAAPEPAAPEPTPAPPAGEVAPPAPAGVGTTPPADPTPPGPSTGKLGEERGDK